MVAEQILQPAGDSNNKSTYRKTQLFFIIAGSIGIYFIPDVSVRDKILGEILLFVYVFILMRKGETQRNYKLSDKELEIHNETENKNKSFLKTGIIIVTAFSTLVLVVTKDFSIAGASLFFSLLVALLAWSYFVKKGSVSLMDSFARELNFSFSKNGDVQSIDTILQLPGTGTIKNIFSGNIGTYPVRIFNHTLTRDQGNDRTTFEHIFFEIKTNHVFPTMLILSKEKARSSLLDLKNELLSKKEEVTLEGNFSKFFDVSVAINKQQEIREILPPDMMADLLDKAQQKSFIFSNGFIYIAVANFNSDFEEVRPLFSREVMLKDLDFVK